MHVQNRYAAVNDVHAIPRENVRDGSAAADIDLAKLCRLRNDAFLIEDRAKMRDVFRTRVIGTALAAGTREFVEYHASAEVSGIFLLKTLRP